MVLATDEKTPLRVAEEGDRRRDDAASSGADRHHAHRVSHRNADAAALRPDAFPAVDDADAEHRRAIRGLVRSMGAAATMAATAAALVVVVWTQRTHTLQDSWRPVPGLDLHATFAADEGVAGTSAGGAFAGALAAVRGASGGAGLADAEASLGAGQKGDAESSEAPFYMDDDAYRAYAPLLACVAESAAYTPLGVDLALFESLATHPWRVLEPCDASVFVVPALPASIPTSARPECAGARLDPAALRAAALAAARRSPHFAARGGEDHAVFKSESGDAFFVSASAESDEARESSSSRKGKSKERRGRSLLADAGDALFPEGVKPQYYRMVAVPERPHARRAVVEAASTPAVSAETRATTDAAEATSAAAALGARPAAEAPRRVAGRWARAPGLRPQARAPRFVVAALGDGAQEVPSGAYTRLSHLLKDAAERARAGLGEGGTPSSACAEREPGALASLGSAPRRLSRRSGLGDASELVRELTESSAARASDPSDPEALVRELTAPKKPSARASFPADPELREVEIGGSVVPPEETFALPGEASAGDVVAGDDAPTEEPVEVGGSIAPPKDGGSVLDALETAGAALLADAAPAGEDASEDAERETAEEEEEEEDVFEDWGSLGETGEEAAEDEDALEDALKDASDDVNREAAEEEEEEEDAFEDSDVLDEPDEAEDAPEDDAFDDVNRETAEEEREDAFEDSDVLDEPDEAAPEDDAPANVEADEPEGDAYDAFARSIAEVLHANRGEAESRAAARAAAGELTKSLDDKAESGTSLTDDQANVGAHAASADAEEQLAERVAELLRPRVGMGGLDGAGAGSPLVNINVNTNTGGVTSLGGGGGGDEVPSGAVAAASTSTDLYARLMQALSAKGGGGEPDASLRDAAAHFVDELAKQVPTMGTLESPAPRRAEGAAGDSAALEALPEDRLDDSVTSAAKAAGLDDLLYRAALAASRSDARVSEAKEAKVPGRVPVPARAKVPERDERVGEVSRVPETTRAALDDPGPTERADATVEALRLRLEKAERDETALAARLEAVESDASAIPDARREFLVEESARLAREEDEDEPRTSRARARTAPDPLDEDPTLGAEMAGIDGVIRTAEAMSEVWAADPKMRVGAKADAPAAVAGRTDVLRANVPLRDDASRRRRKKSGVLGETRRAEDEPAGDETEARTAVGSLLRELGARRA